MPRIPDLYSARRNAIKEALHNLSLDENNNRFDPDWSFYNGLVVGIVSTLISAGYSFHEAIGLVKSNLPAETVDLSKLSCGWFQDPKAK